MTPSTVYCLTYDGQVLPMSMCVVAGQVLIPFVLYGWPPDPTYDDDPAHDVWHD